MPSSWMLHRVALVRTDVSEERSASIIKVTRICELGTTLAITSNRRTLPRNTIMDEVLHPAILIGQNSHFQVYFLEQVRCVLDQNAVLTNLWC
jgi:hypothetical protein